MSKQKLFMKYVATFIVFALIIGVSINKNLLISKAKEKSIIDFGTIYYEETLEGITYTLSSVKDADSTCVYIRKSDSNNFSKVYYKN